MASVRALDTLTVRRVGAVLFVFVYVHVRAAPALPLHDAHIVRGGATATIRRAVPVAAGVLGPMEPFQSTSS